jgi:predicted small integral membrane protein
MIRISKIVLIALVAVWGAIGGIKNFADISGGVGATAAVMNPGPEARVPEWQAITYPIVVWLGWVLIPLGKLAAAGMCSVGAWRMWGARKLDPPTFNAAKELGLAGCAFAIAMLFGVFFVFGSTYFNLWMTPVGNVALPIAFQLIGSIGLIALFVYQKD